MPLRGNGGKSDMKNEITQSDAYNRFMKIVEKTDKDNPRDKDIQALRQILSEHPEVLDFAGDLAIENELKIINDSKMTVAVRETIIAKLGMIRNGLGYGEVPLLEKMLIEQVILSWLRLNIWEFKFSILETQGMPLTKASFWEKRMSAALWRYLRACESLARIRKLSKQDVALQVNIARDFVKFNQTT
jgi:hypothetical protein